MHHLWGENNNVITFSPMYAHLSKTDRLALYVLLNKGYSQRDMAKALSISPSTVSREFKRNVMRQSNEYVRAKANQKAYVRRKYSKYQGMKINKDRFLENYVVKGLEAHWTPEEISGKLKVDHSIILGFKSIYSWLESVYGQNYAYLLPFGRKVLLKIHFKGFAVLSLRKPI